MHKKKLKRLEMNMCQNKNSINQRLDNKQKIHKIYKQNI